MSKIHTKPVILITGASSGIGECLATSLADEGYLVVATMRQLKHIKTIDNLVVKTLDVQHVQQIEQCVAEVIQEYGRIDVLINNAGYAAGEFVEEADLDAWQEQMDTNLFGSIRVTQAVLPHMRRARSGKILFVGSISGRYAFPGFAPYASTKFALEALAESLRHEVKPYNIYSVIIELGAIKTAIWEKGLEQAKDKERPNSPYAEAAKGLQRYVNSSAKQAESPLKVAALVHKIIQKERPGLRYALGFKLKLLLLAKFLLPWRWLEVIIAKSLKE